MQIDITIVILILGITNTLTFCFERKRFDKIVDHIESIYKNINKQLEQEIKQLKNGK